MVQRLLPHNIEAERAVLGSLLIDPDAVVQVADFLTSEDFYRNAHRILYGVILQLYHQRVPSDFVTVCDILEQQDHLDEVGGSDTIAGLINYVPTSGNVVYYGRIVSRTALLRRLIHAGGEIVAQAYEDREEDAAQTLERAEQMIFEISQHHEQTMESASHVRELITAYMERLDQIHEHRGTLMGVPTGFADLDRMLGGLQRSDLIVLAGRPGMGKCLPAWTLIDNPETGERLTIEEYVQRQIPFVYGLTEDGKVRQTMVSHWVNSGVKPCYRIRTKLGRMIEATEQHPFLTVHGWEALCYLTVGNHIAVPREVKCFGNDENWHRDLVRLLAYYIAEGGLTHGSPRFTNTDPVIVEDFKRIIASHFPVCTVKQYRITYTPSQPRKVGGAILPQNPVTQWLAELGLMGKHAKDKKFPPCVWTWSKRYLAEFMRALMSCDGCIYSLKGRPIIEFSVASSQLAADVYHALLRFGIIAKYCKTSGGAWRVEVTNSDSVARYQQEIGWIGEKAARFADWSPVSSSGKVCVGNKGHIPREVWPLIQAAVKIQKISFVEMARRCGETTKAGHSNGYNPHTCRSLPRYRLAAYANILNDGNLRRASSCDIYWDEIVSIEYIGEHQVYDLTVPDGSNFIAQDVFVHNSAMALSIAHHAAKQQGRRVGIFSLEMSKEQLMQRLMAIEAEVDQQHLRNGWIEDDEWERIVAAMNEITNMEIWIDDTASISTIQLRSKARRWVLEHDIDLIIVDYLQLMTASTGDGQKIENRTQEVSKISRALKGLARELNLPILALAQLSRAVENRASKVPQLSDLRESGSIEADSDVVLLIYRDDAYHPDSERPNTADLIVAKQRNGPVGVVVLDYEKRQTRFRDVLSDPTTPSEEESESSDEEEERGHQRW